MRGTLVDTSPADLFVRLAEQSATGMLTLTGPDGEASVLFAHGAIAAARAPSEGTSRGLRLGERLIHAGRLEADELDQLLAAQQAATAPVTLGHLVVERGLVPPDVVRVLLQEQALDALGTILPWRTGEYGFEVDPAPAARVGVQLPVARALVELRRRARERSRVSELVPGPTAVPQPTSRPSGETRMSPDAVSVLAAVDGRDSVGAIASTLGYGYDEASRIVYRLALQGLVQFQDDAAPPAPSPPTASPATPAPTTAASGAPDRPAAAMPDTSWSEQLEHAGAEDEPAPWVGWANAAEEPAGPPAEAGASREAGADAAAPAATTRTNATTQDTAPTGGFDQVDEDTRRALFSELHEVSRADPGAAPEPAPAPAPDEDDEQADAAPELHEPEAGSPDLPTTGRQVPDLSGDEVSSLLRELHDLNRDDD